MKKKSRKGFTFVEVIFTLIIIAALMATFMLVYKDTVVTAKANSIVANLQTVKDAAILYRMTTPHPTIDEFVKDAKLYLGDIVNVQIDVPDLETSTDNTIIKTYWKGSVLMASGNVSYRIWSLVEIQGNNKNTAKELGIWKAQCNYGTDQYSKKSITSKGDPDCDAIRNKLFEMAPDAGLLTDGLLPYTDINDRKVNTNKTYKVAVRVE